MQAENKSPIQIINFDREPDPTNRIASVVIADPNGEDYSFCLAFKHEKGPLSNPESWKFDHVYMRGIEDIPLEDKDMSVQKRVLERKLARHRSSTDDVLKLYCQKLSERR